jgi:hypothetical protein
MVAFAPWFLSHYLSCCWHEVYSQLLISLHSWTESNLHYAHDHFHHHFIRRFQFLNWSRFVLLISFFSFANKKWLWFLRKNWFSEKFTVVMENLWKMYFEAEHVHLRYRDFFWVQTTAVYFQFAFELATNLDAVGIKFSLNSYIYIKNAHTH